MHSEVRSFFMKELDMGYGDAAALASYLAKSNGNVTGKIKPIDSKGALDEIYSGAKANLLPIHEAIMQRINTFGSFEIAPKKTYLSLRRNRQFAMVGPTTKTRIEVGLNMKGIQPTSRLEQNAPGSMCQYKVKITSIDEVNDELQAWIRLSIR